MTKPKTKSTNATVNIAKTNIAVDIFRSPLLAKTASILSGLLLRFLPKETEKQSRMKEAITSLTLTLVVIFRMIFVVRKQGLTDANREKILDSLVTVVVDLIEMIKDKGAYQGSTTAKYLVAHVVQKLEELNNDNLVTITPGLYRELRSNYAILLDMDSHTDEDNSTDLADESEDSDVNTISSEESA